MGRELAVGLVLAVGACLVGWTASSRAQERVMWEYQEVPLAADAPATPKLNQYGAAGWELVDVISACPSNPNYAASCTYYAYFKRAK